MKKPLLLDLFCGAGGCSEGYVRAGFNVVGVDNKPQPHYPYAFVQSDALDYVASYGYLYAAIHASPPCQGYSVMKHMSNSTHEMLVTETRAYLKMIGKPYVIENVVGAPLICPLMLCGTMFKLETSCGAQLRRHRLFESCVKLTAPGPCRHGDTTIGVQVGERERYIPNTVSVTGSGQPLGGRVISVNGSTPQQFGRDRFPVSEARRAMGIDWMPMKYLSQAIPPDYCEWIGIQLREFLR